MPLVKPLDISFLNELLQPICGQPLTGMWRPVGQLFEFGVQKPSINRRGEPITRGDFDLKFIGADWRVVHQGRIIMGSYDHDGEGRFYKSVEPPCRPYDADARALAKEFLADVTSGKYIAESIKVGRLADITVVLSDGLVIESFASSGIEDSLWWCHNLRTNVSCLVFPSGYVIQGRDEK